MSVMNMKVVGEATAVDDAALNAVCGGFSLSLVGEVVNQVLGNAAGSEGVDAAGQIAAAAGGDNAVTAGAEAGAAAGSTVSSLGPVAGGVIGAGVGYLTSHL